MLQLLRCDWGLFDESTIDEASATELLKDILQDQRLHQRLYSPANRSASEGLEQWKRLREEMLHRNRWFLPNPLDPDRIREWLGHLIADPSLLDRSWFRARLLDRSSAFTADEMGAPPPQLAQHGRANPAGIPYLYLGSTPDTGVAEIRPHRGERVCVAKFELRGAGNFIDLRDPRPTASPFIVEDSDQVQRLYDDLPLLEHLGQELTRPVLRQSTDFDYTPSQFLCELIKSTGFDGVLYGSSVSNGINLAVFDPEKASAIGVEVREVSKVQVETSKYIPLANG